VSQIEALLLTIAVEVPVGLAAALVMGPKPIVWSRMVVALLAVSLATHPIAWWLAGEWRAWPFPLRAAVIEACVVIVEAGLLWVAVPLAPGRAFAVAAAINLASFGVGYGLTH